MNSLSADLDHILAHTPEVWPALRGKRLFITGGTGFFGCWLLESFAWANRALDLGASALVLSRDPPAFARKCPHLAQDPALGFLDGDVRSFEFPGARFDYVLHAAAEASAALNRDAPWTMFDTLVGGTRRVLDFAVARGARGFLLTSSGAVYGKQPPELTHVPEEYTGGPDPLDAGAAYAEGKRAAEHMCALYAHTHGLQVKVARCFTFVGPRLPLDRHFAVGNFIRDGLQGGPIRVNGDGTPYRSYLYASDLAVWLWNILVRGAPGRAYNVGSEAALTIADLARKVAAAFDPAPEVVIASGAEGGGAAARYVPATARARADLRLRETVTVERALARTIAWHRQTPAAEAGGQ